MKNIVKFSSIVIALCMLLSFTACDTAAPMDEPEGAGGVAAISEELPIIIGAAGMIEDQITLWQYVSIKPRVYMEDRSNRVIFSEDPESRMPVDKSYMNLSDEYRDMLIQALQTPPYENTLFYLNISVPEELYSYINDELGMTVEELMSSEVLRLRELGYNVWLSNSESNGYCIKGLLSYDRILNFPPSEEHQELIYHMELG